MKTKHLPYHLGIIIPVCLILLNGATTYFSTVKYDSPVKQCWFGAAYCVVWITYVLAIFTRPGFTDGSVEPGAKYVTCLKCNRPKPERAHHCRQCGRCVLRMDHHCPWTENCVGFRNLPHFMRFLGSAILLNAYGVYRTAAFLIYALEHRKYLAYFVPNKSRISVGIIAVLGDLFVLLTLVVLWLRVVLDTVNGHTQIENWEIERAAILARRKLAMHVEFPFDVDLFTNVRSAFGEVWDWFLPFATPPGSGHIFPRLPDCDERWPPAENAEVAQHEFYRKDRWTSFEGEGLADYGVDSTAEALAAAATTTLSNELAASSQSSPSSTRNDEDTPLADIRLRQRQKLEY